MRFIWSPLKKTPTLDKKRSKYHEHYTGQDCEDMKRYNLCIDTSEVGIKGAIEIILSALKHRENDL